MIPGHLLPFLAADADQIARGYLQSGARGQTIPASEPDFVAAIVIGAIAPIAQAWARRLRPARISLTLQAVFCHGQPQVTFPPTGKHVYPIKTIANVQVGQCELADLLLVIDDTTGDPKREKIVARRAALVQAKMLKSATSTRLSLSGNERAQLDLLENWPVFDFASPGYASKSRDFKSGAGAGIPITGGSYGIIDKYQIPPDWQHAQPTLPIQTPGIPFGTYFAGLADGGSTASGRAATPGGLDDWSLTIDELLSKTGVASLNLASLKSFPVAPARGVRHFAYFHSGTSDASMQGAGWTLHAGGPGQDGSPGDAGPDEAPQGISTIRIIISRGGG